MCIVQGDHYNLIFSTKLLLLLLLLLIHYNARITDAIATTSTANAATTATAATAATTFLTIFLNKPLEYHVDDYTVSFSTRLLAVNIHQRNNTV